MAQSPTNRVFFPPLSTQLNMQMFGEIPDFLIAWLDKQHMFWVASAPLTADGLVNISPKGVEGTFHIASPRRVWYEDLSGSGWLFTLCIVYWIEPLYSPGVETISHIRENQRMTILFNAFEGPPRIVRLYGKGQSRPCVPRVRSPIGCHQALYSSSERLSTMCFFQKESGTQVPELP